MKILHFVSKMDRAGQESFIMNVYRNINRNRFQFSFLCTNQEQGDFDSEIKDLGGKIFYLPKNRYSNGAKRYVQDIMIISKWLKDNKNEYDIVHLHTYHAVDVFVHVMACRMAKCKHLVVHSHNTSGEHQRLHMLFRSVNNMFSFTRFACSFDAGIWLYGKEMMRKGKVQVVYNGINPEDYRYSQQEGDKYREMFGLKGKTVIGHIGRFSTQKNHFRIISIFTQYLNKNPDAVLVLVGKGELQEEIMTSAEKNGISNNVMFLGTREDIPQLMALMDIMLFPSLYEGLSVVLVEAQASGLKCVISDNILPPEENIIPQLFTNVSLKKSNDVWIDLIGSALDIEIDRNECCDKMIESGFNIVNTTRQLECEYEKINKE